MGIPNFNTLRDAEMSNIRQSLPADAGGRNWNIRFQESTRTIIAQELTQSGVRTTLYYSPSSALIDALNERIRQGALVLIGNKIAA